MRSLIKYVAHRHFNILDAAVHGWVGCLVVSGQLWWAVALALGSVIPSAFIEALARRV